MITIRALILIPLLFIISGCATKVTYEKAPNFTFQKIELPVNGIRVDAGTKEVQRMCTPVVLEVSTVLRGVIDFHDDQIDRYRRSIDANRPK